MTENDIHKCLISHGFYPMTLILKELEKENRFLECEVIFKAMLSYREKFKIVKDDIPTQWSEEFEKQYYSYFNNHYLVKENIPYYLKDIRSRLKL
jgi:hypothetical protein